MLKHSCNTEITDLDLSILGHENILSFEISVQNFTIMNMFDS
jgi:hypothetical protein